MIENSTKRQDNSADQIDDDYGRPSKKPRMSVEPFEEKSAVEPQGNVNSSLPDEYSDTDEMESRPVEVTHASDLYLDTVGLVLSF